MTEISFSGMTEISFSGLINEFENRSMTNMITSSSQIAPEVNASEKGRTLIVANDILRQMAETAIAPDRMSRPDIVVKTAIQHGIDPKTTVGLATRETGYKGNRMDTIDLHNIPTSLLLSELKKITESVPVPGAKKNEPIFISIDAIRTELAHRTNESFLEVIRIWDKEDEDAENPHLGTKCKEARNEI